MLYMLMIASYKAYLKELEMYVLSPSTNGLEFCLPPLTCLYQAFVISFELHMYYKTQSLYDD